MPQYISSTDTAYHAFFHIITIEGSTDQLIGSLYVNPSPGTVQHFKALNWHLGHSVSPGRIAIVSPPDSLTCTLIEADMQAFAMRVDQRLQAMEAREAEIAARNHGLLSNIAGHSGAGYGIAMNYFNQHRKQIESHLKRIETLYVKSYNTQGGLKHPEFLAQRRALFRELDNTLDRMVGRGLLGPDIAPGNIKRSLGISTKSILHDWRQQGGPAKDIPGYADNHIKITRMAETLKRAGYVGLALDIGRAGVNLHQACTVGREDDACARTSFREGGRLIGSIGGGIAGGYIASWAVCSLVFSIPSAGTSALWCGIVAGGAGGYIGGSNLSDYFASKSEFIYEHDFSKRER